MVDFRGKNILITGASSGIGAAIACEFASHGANLFLIARNMDRLAEVRQRCAALGSSVNIYGVDMTSQESVDAFVNSLMAEGTRLDGAVLNAGISQRAEAFDTDMSVVRKVMETNFFGPVYLTGRLASLIQASEHFSLAVTTSISGLFGFPLRSSYCASKHALFGYFESLETENPNVRVTFLIPGRINTPISKSAVLGNGSSYSKMDPGQANGMAVERCASIAYKAIAKGRHRRLIGGKELLMVYIKKYCPWLFFKIAGRISAT